MEELKKNGIGTQVHYIPAHTQPYYRLEFGYEWGDYPKAEEYYSQTLSLPLYPKMSDAEVFYVIDKIKELNVCFYKNDDVINKSKRILNKYGIKFLTLDRPSQTPVDGKSFMSNKNPAIALSLKYKRLDNFAFTLFHELGHVFEHLTNPDKPQYNDVEFFIDNNSTTEIVEYEADKYATEKLIDVDLFNDFMVMNDEYTDEIILDFSRKNKVHPGIVRGRVCYFHNEYYRKRSSITSLNRLKL
jgi:HTH-type transcriptional regulator/antitoxin HigA